MHVLFVHPVFPAQFGHVAHYLATAKKWHCTVVTSIDTSRFDPHRLPFEIVNYQVRGHYSPYEIYNPPTLQGRVDHMNAIYARLRELPRLRPDVVVGHLTYGTILFLRNLYPCPFIGYFEWLPPLSMAGWQVFRKDFPPTEDSWLSSGVYHAFNYLQLHAVDTAYTPTRFQLSTAPKELQGKIRVIHDGVNTEFFQPRRIDRPFTFRGLTVDRDTRVVTYASPGLESMRGFDIFMRVAQRIRKEMSNVIFLIAGAPRTHYGFEESYLPANMSFKEWVLRQDNYDPQHFHFLGILSAPDLAMLFNLSDLHCYLTMPFVLSWSLVQAMASGCTILGSATPPVQEAIDDGVHGLLADFYDVDTYVRHALTVLKDPAAHRQLGHAARGRALERYDMPRCNAQLAAFVSQTAQTSRTL